MQRRKKKKKKESGGKNSKRVIVDRKIYKCIECACAKCERKEEHRSSMFSTSRDSSLIFSNRLELICMIYDATLITRKYIEINDNPSGIFASQFTRDRSFVIFE